MHNSNDPLLKYTFPTKPSSDGYYHIHVTDETKKSGRKSIKSRTLEDLYKKVLQHEKNLADMSLNRFKDVFDTVVQRKTRLVKDKEKLLSIQNTVIRIRCDYKRYFAGTEFEDMPIEEITKKDVDNICLYNLERYNMTKKAFASLRGILKSVFDYALSEYMIEDNVYTRILFKDYNDMLVKPAAVEKRVHSKNEVSDILGELHRRQARRPKLSSLWAFELQILMGLRRGEVPPLMWSDISDTNICISKEQITSGNDFIVVGHTKNYKTRYFPITNDLKEFLERLKAMQDKYYPNSEYLFPANTKSGIITNRAVYLLYRSICNELNIKIDKDLIRGPHSFRRNAITDVVNATNGNIIMASCLFGNTPNVAKDNYFTGTNLETAKSVLDTRTLTQTVGNQK